MPERHDHDPDPAALDELMRAFGENHEVAVETTPAVAPDEPVLDDVDDGGSVGPLQSMKDGVQYLVTGDARIELGIALFHLTENHVDHVRLQFQGRIVDLQHPAILMTIRRRHLTRQTKSDDVDIGDGFIRPVLAAPLDLEFTHRQVSVEPEVAFDEIHGDVHAPIVAPVDK